MAVPILSLSTWNHTECVFCFANSPYLYGLGEEPLRALRQPRHRVVDGRVLAELSVELPHHRRLEIVASGGF